MRKKTLIWIVLASFAIGLFCIVPNVSATEPIGFGEIVYTSIGSETEMDTYTFSANAGDSVVIRMKSTWYDYPEIRLYAPNGSLISRDYEVDSSEITKTLSHTGGYNIVVEDHDGDDAGNYTLFVQRLNNPGATTLIKSGETKPASIDSETEMDAYTFSANAGDSVVIRMKSTWYDYPEIRLYAPNGSLISRDYEVDSSEITKTLSHTGKYTLIAEDHDGDDTGNYSLYVYVMGINVPPPTDEGDEEEIPGVPTTPVEKEEKETPEVPTTPCESDQLFFQGKCIEISSLFEKDNDKEGISEEQYRSIIENFDNLKKEDRGKLEKLADYLESEINNTLDKHEYEAAKTYTSLLEITYYQLGNTDKIYETKKRYGEIKKDYFWYKLKNPFHNPLEPFFAVVFAVIFAFVADALLHIREKRKLGYLIAIFLGMVIVSWAIISVILTMLR